MKKENIMHSSIRHKVQAVIWISTAAMFLSVTSSFSQISLNGIVDVNDYAGSQTGLVEGVSTIPATGKPLVRHVYMAGPDVVAIIIDEKACILSNLRPYRPDKHDTMVMAGYHGFNKLRVRKEDTLGYICGWENNWHRPFNSVAGEPLDTGWASDPDHYTVTSPDDPAFKNGVRPLSVFRKSEPNEMVTRLLIRPTSISTLRHHIFLRMPVGLTTGKHYRVHFDNHQGSFQDRVSFCLNDAELRSEAIHVNLYGYGTGDQKVAFLSSWMGDGGQLELPEGLRFRIVDPETGETVYEGAVRLKQPAGEAEYVIDGIPYNHNRTHVYEMDFSPLREQGRYKLIVEGIGCSFDFLVDDEIWENTARLLMKGFLHQRAGIELGPPYTDYIRPRNLHPADGHTIHKCDPEKYSAAPRGHFTAIQQSILEETSVPEAWGGWMDAGDYDRRMKHFYTVRRMMYLHELNPQYFEQLDFNIPESSNQIPDILDEALWCLDLFKRTQGVYEEGAVSSWVESVEHPRHGETSWLNSLPTAIIPPTASACIDYAGVAAHMAILLRKYDADLALGYEKSALAAMEWSDRNPDPPAKSGRREGRDDTETSTYLNLYRLTGDKKWHRRFTAGMEVLFPEGMAGHLTYSTTNVATIYSLMDPSMVEENLREECRSAIIAFADELVEGAAEVTHGILRLKGQPLSRLVPMKGKILPVVMAHRITGDDKYRDALARTMQYTMGLNPLNKSYISGLGERSFKPYHHDWHADMLHIPAGIPNFGPVTVRENSRDHISHPWSDAYQVPLETALGLYPSELKDWPLPEACFDQMWITPVNEFMVETPMGELLLLSAYLAFQQ